MLPQDVRGVFAASDWDQDGLLQGAEAVSFFQRTGLPDKQLRRVSSHMLGLQCGVLCGARCSPMSAQS